MFLADGGRARASEWTVDSGGGVAAHLFLLAFSPREPGRSIDHARSAIRRRIPLPLSRLPSILFPTMTSHEDEGEHDESPSHPPSLLAAMEERVHAVQTHSLDCLSGRSPQVRASAPRQITTDRVVEQGALSHISQPCASQVCSPVWCPARALLCHR